MSRGTRRDQAPRYCLTPLCRGEGAVAGSAHRFEFRGTDVSLHGFGCVIIGTVRIGDQVSLVFGAESYRFEVTWVESHLGIDNQYRAGLLCLDRNIDFRDRMAANGFLGAKIEEGAVA